MHFYPRSPCGERRPHGCLRWCCRNFYPRSPCGERPGKLPGQHGQLPISIHALLAESDLVTALCSHSHPHFYPRSPCGERLVGHAVIHQAIADFYPRSPCGERRQSSPKPLVSSVFLSTLSLRRATGQGDTLVIVLDISIHALLAESDWRWCPSCGPAR